jgi:ankyrin repeat protein
VQDILRLTAVSRGMFSKINRDDYLWRTIHKRSFGSRKPPGPFTWREHCLKTSGDLRGFADDQVKEIFFWAAATGNTRIIEQTLAHDDGLVFQKQKGKTALQVAAKRGQAQVVKLLLRYNAHPDGNTKKASPLYFAAQNGYEKNVLILLQGKARIEWVHIAGGGTPLHVACHKGHLGVVKILLAHGANVEATTNARFTPLYLAARAGHYGIVHTLLEHNADVDSPNFKGSTPLYVAAKKGHYDVVELLLAFQANVRSVLTKSQFSPLHSAALRGHQAIVELLIRRGADVEAGDGGEVSPLILAAERGHSAVIETLLDHGANAEAYTTRHHTTGLYMACLKGHLPVVKILLQHNANVQAQSKSCQTPLHAAALKGFGEIVLLLLQHNALVNARNSKGMTPLHYSAESGHRDTVRILLEHGAEVDAANNKDETALFLACSKGHLDLVDDFVLYGANVKVVSQLLKPDEDALSASSSSSPDPGKRRDNRCIIS